MSEKSQIKRMGGRAQPNSGRGSHSKGDAVLGSFLVDVKEYSKSFSVSVDNWTKLKSDAWLAGQYVPAFNLVLGNGQARLWVVDDHTFRQMRELWEEKYGRDSDEGQ